MAALTPIQQANLRDVAAVRDFFAGMSNADVFKYCLNLNRHDYPTAPALAQSTIVVCLDTEGWDASSIVLKELGINTFDSRDMARLQSPGPWGENLLKHVFFYFARIQKNAHLLNRNYSAGNPETNRFGQMRFLDDREITACLQEIFEWPLNNKGDGCVCPIVLLGHALDNDVEKMQKLLEFDPLAKGNLVKQIDTQVIARDVGHWKHPVNQIGLQRLVNDMGFAYRDSHTASNDAAMTLIAAMQLVLDSEFKDPSRSKTLQDVIDEVEKKSRGHDWHHGSSLFCFRCASRSHTKERSTNGGPCRVKVHCEHCQYSRPDSQFGHRSEACVMKAFETSNSSRPNPKRHRKRGSTMLEAVGSARKSSMSAAPGATQDTQEVLEESIANMALAPTQARPSVPSEALATLSEAPVAVPSEVALAVPSEVALAVPSEVRMTVSPAPPTSWASIASRNPSDEKNTKASRATPKSRFTPLRPTKDRTSTGASRHVPKKDHE